MKKYLFITCGLALMVSAATVLAGCSSDDDDLLSNPAILSQNEWKLDYLKEGEKMAECPFLPNDEHYYTISFNKEQHFKAILACYHFEGEYVADSVNIQLRETYSSEYLKWLRPDYLAQHWEFDNLLEKTILECNKYSISGNTLRLFSNNSYSFALLIIIVFS